MLIFIRMKSLKKSVSWIQGIQLKDWLCRLMKKALIIRAFLIILKVYFYIANKDYLDI